MLRKVAALASLVLLGATLIVVQPAGAALDIHPGDEGDLYLSSPDSVTLRKIGGGTFTLRNEDVAFFDASQNAFAMVFDGSNVGLSSAVIDAMMMVGNASDPMAGIYLSFTSPRTISGIPGTVDDSDVVFFKPTSLGDGHTAGTFETYLDGSDLGLTTDSEDVDAIDHIDDALFLSTTGTYTASSLGKTIKGNDEDLIECGIDNGTDSSCTFFNNLDRTAAGFSADSEDVDGFALTGHFMYFSTTGSATLPGMGGAAAANEDVARCDNPNAAPEDSAETCDPPGLDFDEYFDGGDHGIPGNLSAIEVPLPPGTE